MKIRVTRQHINQGEICDAFRCPVALALCDAGFHRPAVSSIRIALGDGRLETNDAVFAFVTAFDNMQPVVPFEFEVPDPE